MKEQRSAHPGEKLLLFLESRLNNEERQAIAKHLTSCDECRQELAFIEKLGALLPNVEMEQGPCPSALTLMMFHYGELPSEAERDVKRHLINCRQCAREVVALEQEEAIGEELNREGTVPEPSPLMYSPIVIRMLRLPENREVIRVLCQQVLAEVAPDEVEVTVDLIDPLIAEASRGQLSPVSTSYQAGGFGGADVMVKAVVPAVVEAVSLLLKGLDTIKLEAMKGGEKAKTAPGPRRVITAKKIQPIVDRTQSRKG